jgi:hypothetical protein
MATFSDSFNRADSSNLGVDWVEVSGDWSIVSNTLSPGTSGSTVVLRAAGAMATNDNYAQAKIAATSAVSNGLWCRGDSTLTSGYLWRNNGTSWDLFSVVGGTFTVIGTYTAAAAVGDIAKVQAFGTTIKGFVNGVERVSVTNTAVSTGTSVGFRCMSTASIAWDDFSAGDVVVGATLGISGSSETAQPVTGDKSSTLGSSTASETTQPVSGAKSSTLGISSETDESENLTGSKSGSLGISSETDESQNLTGSKTSQLGVSSETPEPENLAPGKTASLGTSGEEESSQSLSGSGTASLGISGTDETSEPIAGSKEASLTPALEVSMANPIREEVSNVGQSILVSIKKVMGLAEDDNSFDIDLIMHINSVFSDLAQLGVGPDNGFEIYDEDPTWDSFTDGNVNQNSVKSYMYLRVRMMFDPPGTSFALDSMEKQIQKYEWRLNVEREGRLWQDPTIQTV